MKDVNDEDIAGEDDEERDRALRGEISAVISIAEYACCKFCKSKVVSEDNLLAECSKCSALMKLSCCNQTKSAKFVVSEDSSGRETTLSAFEPVRSLANCGWSEWTQSIR